MNHITLLLSTRTCPGSTTEIVPPILHDNTALLSKIGSLSIVTLFDKVVHLAVTGEHGIPLIVQLPKTPTFPGKPSPATPIDSLEHLIFLEQQN